MRYLVDTHVLLWATMSKRKLSSACLSAMSTTGNKLYISQISLWEISLKFGLNKLDLKGTSPENLLTNTKKSGFKILRLKTKVATSYYKLPRYENKDPFDRMLAWQAIQEGMILISDDRGFDLYKKEGLRRFW